MPSRPLADADISLILSNIDISMHKCLFILGIRTGFRISELLSLTLGDVSDKGRVRDAVTVRRCNMKGKRSSRSVVLHDQAKEALRELLSTLTLDSSPLFPISRFTAHRIIKAAVKASGLEGRISTHSMRKSFAMKIYDRTHKDIVAVQRALGHASLASTTKYLSVGQDVIDNAILGD